MQWNGEGRKKWGKAQVEYTYNGEARKQNVMSFTNPDVFKKVQELEGQAVEVELTKNEKGYNEWKSIQVQSAGSASSGGSGSPAASATTTRVSGSNYETKEERAARQVLIVKQSSLSTAAEILSVGAKTPPAKESVTELAQYFTDWVFNKEDDDGSIAAMKDDIPF